MRVDDFDFDLPRRSIADRPAVPRDAARLLHVLPDGLADRGMRDLPGLLLPGDVLVVNDSRVIPARLHGLRRRPGIDPLRVEIMLHKAEGGPRWRAFARPGKRLKVGDAVDFGGGFSAEIADKSPDGDVGVIFDREGADLAAALERCGEMPLPPYIRRPDGADERDRTDYQTVYAAKDGSVAAPTAGLHFTPDLLAAVAARGVERIAVTLHVGAGTFLPVKAEDTADHVMHSEWGTVSAAAAARINAARAAGRRLVAVGTTACRILESAAQENGEVRAFSGETAIFMTPGYRFRAVDRLLTNFHLPKSTLFMLVSAFSGLARMKSAYAHAVASGYRFYSYGDACFLEPERKG
jgi:S-adenosylmethionine:tRNA ribosyltransferase-isomerase